MRYEVGEVDLSSLGYSSILKVYIIQTNQGCTSKRSELFIIFSFFMFSTSFWQVLSRLLYPIS